MILTEITAIDTAAIPVAAAKEHLRLGTGFSDENLQDDLVEAYLRAAIATIEGKIGLVLVPRLFNWQLTEWRRPEKQILPVRPCSAITEIKMVDRLGAATIVDPEQYDFAPDVLAPAIIARGAALPKVPTGGTIEILFEAGYGPGWAALPSDLAQATMLLTAQFYEHRSGAPNAAGNLPIAVLALLERHRPARVFGGA